MKDTIDLVFQDTRWGHGFTIFAFACLAAGIIFLIAPTIYYNETDFNGEIAPIAVRTVIYFLGCVLLSLSPIYIEKFFYNRKRLQAGRSGTFDSFTLCMWISVFQFAVVICLFWLDLVPFVGSAPSIKQFFQTVNEESTCLFQLGYCPDSVWMGFMFTLSWFVEILLTIKLAKDSANYVQVLSTMSTPLVICFWIAFPWWETTSPEWPPSSLWQNTPVWSVVPALFFFTVATIVFKLWEMRQASLQRPILAY